MLINRWEKKAKTAKQINKIIEKEREIKKKKLMDILNVFSSTSRVFFHLSGVHS